MNTGLNVITPAAPLVRRGHTDNMRQTTYYGAGQVSRAVRNRRYPNGFLLNTVERVTQG
jgi:hypothetical protein